MSLPLEIDRVFRRLDQKVIDRHTARAAVKQLVALRPESARVVEEIDNLFDKHDMCVTGPLTLVYAVQKLVDRHLAAVEGVGC